MARAAAITRARTGASRLWAGTVTIHPNAKTGAHHHGDLESVIYVVTGPRPGAVGRSRWKFAAGGRARATSSTCRRSCLHREINASRDEPRSAVVLVRGGQEPVVVNLDIAPAEPQSGLGGRHPSPPEGR
mgnify:CR=1 FL=1